jgi:spermidine synthase
MRRFLPGHRAIGLPFAAFFLSGAAGLIYEVSWIRRASLVFGSTVPALSTVLAVFFLGLALGSETFGRMSRRIAAPLRLYAGLEIGLAGLALLSVPAFGLVDPLYGLAYRAAAGHGAVLTLARVGLISLILLPPTLLMGATFPLICRQFVRDAGEITRPVAWLYALNTLGALAGCAAAGFFLLPAFGVSGTIGLGACLSVSAAALVLVRRTPELTRVVARREVPRPTVVRRYPIVLAVIFLSGFAALACEVLWARFLGLVIHNTVYTYTLTLVAVLLGIVLGSVAAGRLPDRTSRVAALFGGLQILMGLAVLSVMLLSPVVWRSLGNDVGTVALLMLPAAILSGASFPIGVRMVVDDPALAGLGVGRVTAMNTLGGIAGSLVTGFWLLPRGGLGSGLLVVTGVSLAAGLIATLLIETERPRLSRLAFAAAAVGLWLALPHLLPTRIPADFLRPKKGELIDYREGLVSNVAVLRNDGVTSLEIDRWWQGQGTTTHQIMAAHVPMLLRPDARRVLVVGLGVGQTAHRFLLYDIARLDCVDIEPALFEVVPKYFGGAWTKDPRVALLPEDGRSYVAHTGERYDVISIEVGLAFRPGVPAFYTTDFYRRARSRLAPGGVLSQFLPIFALPSEVVPGLIASFREVFPQSVLWYNTSEALLIGINADTFHLDRDGLLRDLARPAVRSDLALYSHWGGAAASLDRPDVLLGGFLCGPTGLKALAGHAAVFRDDRPTLDYATTKMLSAPEPDVTFLAALRRHLDPVSTFAIPPLPPEDAAKVEEIRETNLGQMVSSALVTHIARAGLSWDDPMTFELVRKAAEACPQNEDAARLMGQALARGGRSAEARVWLSRTVAMYPRDEAAQREIGWLCLQSGQVDSARQHLETAVDLAPWDADALNGFGAALAMAGNYRGAWEEFGKALTLDPANLEIAENLRRAEVRLGRAGR